MITAHVVMVTDSCMTDGGVSKWSACGFSKLHQTIKDGYLKPFEQLNECQLPSKDFSRHLQLLTGLLLQQLLKQWTESCYTCSLTWPCLSEMSNMLSLSRSFCATWDWEGYCWRMSWPVSTTSLTLKCTWMWSRRTSTRKNFLPQISQVYFLSPWVNRCLFMLLLQENTWTHRK